MKELKRSRMIKEFDGWLDLQRSRLHDGAITDIEDLLAKRDSMSEHERALIGHRLDSLSLYLGAEALRRIMAGDSCGWSELKRALHLGYWAIRIRTRVWERNTRRTKRASVLLDDVALYLSLALALRDREVSLWLGERMRLSIQDGAFASWGFAQLRFPAFVLGLFDKSQGRELSVQIKDVSSEPEPYSEVFNAWDYGPRLRDAIEAMCEYHVIRSEESDDYNPEFCYHMFAYFPAEVHAVRNVREDLGLATPQVEHPLLDAPFDDVPRDIALPADPILDAVREYA